MSHLLSSSSIMKESFIVNGFMFCKDHGSELCNICVADYRMDNSSRVSDDHTKIKSAVGGNFDMETRTSLHAYSLGAVFSGNVEYQCKPHSILNCEKCFDWTSLIITQAGDKHFAGWVHSRVDLLGLLRSMGIDMPLATKLSDDALNKKLKKCLKYSQKLSEMFGKSPIDLLKFPVWAVAEAEGLTAFEAMGKFTTGELFERSRNPTQSILYQNAFMDARQTLLHLARSFEMGRTAFLLQDKDSTETICIRVLNIRNVNSETPLIALIYANADSGTPLGETVEFVQTLASAGLLDHIRCTNREQALLRKLLSQNSQRVSSKFKPSLEPYERHFKPSFFIPLYPLEQTDIGRLSSNTGCYLCGDDVKGRRCTVCQSVSYCGPACQKIDWKEHKAVCKTIGGNWLPMSFKNHPTVNGAKLYSAIINKTESISTLSATEKTAKVAKDHANDSPPADVHTDQLFLVKVQKLIVQANPGEQPPVALLVYDRQRSFRAYVMRDDDPTAYQEAMKHIIARNNWNKVYRWAKRTGPFELSVCMDRIPEPEPAW